MAEEYVKKFEKIPIKSSGPKIYSEEESEEVFSELEENKTYTDEELLDLFQEEYASYIGFGENNLPMLALMFDRKELCSGLISTDLFDVNYVNSDGNTIFTKALTKGMLLLCIQLVSLRGYSNFSVKMGRDTIISKCITTETYRPLLPYLIENKTIPEQRQNTVIYRQDYFNMSSSKRMGSGSYGVVRTAIGEDGQMYALKKSLSDDEVFIDADMFKEIMGSRMINKLHPGTCSEIYGFIPEPRTLVMEFLPLTVAEVIKHYKHVDIRLKADFIRIMFKSITEKVAKLNSCGICHFDLKQANIMIAPNGTVKLIDLGLWGLLGLERITIKDFWQTWAAKGPDDPTEKTRYFYKGKEVFVKQKEASYAVNYSTDMYAIATIMFGMIMNNDEWPMQILFTKSATYYYKKEDNPYVKLQLLTPDIKNRIDTISPHLWDLFIRVFTTNSSIRLTTNQALKHPFFNETVTHYSSDIVPYSISEIPTDPKYEDFILPEDDLVLRTNSLSFLDEFCETYDGLMIKKTQNRHFTRKHFTERDIDKLLKGSNMDYDLNYMIYLHQIQHAPRVNEQKLFDDCLRSCLTNKTFENFELDRTAVQAFMTHDITFIPFKSIIIGFICQMRNTCENPNIVRDVLIKVIRGIMDILYNRIDHEFLLINYIMQIAYA